VRGQGLGPVQLCEPEVEQANRHLVALGEQDVRGLDITVDDAAPVCVRQRLEHLGSGLDRSRIVKLACPHRLAQVPSRNVLVGDVDVLVVARQLVRALTSRMPQPSGHQRLAPRACTRLSVSLDHLERHLDARVLVECQPDRPGATAPERAQGAVAAEDEAGRR
jgi:hypothetical protein